MNKLHLPPTHPNGVKRVQVGCGPHNLLPDWWNVDIRDFNGIDQVMDVTKPWPWEEVLDFVYGEHFLEHLKLDDAIEFLRHTIKALKPNGKIRLSTPSLEWVLTTHFDVKQDSPERQIQQTFAINRAFHGWGHQFLYSRYFLKALVEAAGFRDVEFYAYGESNDNSLCGLERHGGYSTAHGFPSVWVVEGTRMNTSVDCIDEQFIDSCREQFMKYVAAGH